MIATGQVRQHIDPHLAATAERLWPAVAWEIDVLERMADGRVDRAELGLGVRGPVSGDRGSGMKTGCPRIPVLGTRTPVFR